jgi:hypothetical protein
MPRQKGATTGTNPHRKQDRGASGPEHVLATYAGDDTGWTGAIPSDGAGTPEELETLLEDALITRDAEALTALFEDHAILVQDKGHATRGHGIAQLALATWHGDHSYIADPRRVIQARDIALIVTAGGINVARRGHDGTWRYAVILQASVEGLDRSTS